MIRSLPDFDTSCLLRELREMNFSHIPLRAPRECMMMLRETALELWSADVPPLLSKENLAMEARIDFCLNLLGYLGSHRECDAGIRRASLTLADRIIQLKVAGLSATDRAHTYLLLMHQQEQRTLPPVMHG